MAKYSRSRSSSHSSVLRRKTRTLSGGCAGTSYTESSAATTAVIKTSSHNWEVDPAFRAGSSWVVPGARTLVVTTDTYWSGSEGYICNMYGSRLLNQTVGDGLSCQGFDPAMSVSIPDRSYIAKNKAIKKAHDLDINLLQAYAERAQIANMLETTCNKLSAAWRAIRKGNVSSALRALGYRGPKRRLTTKDPAQQWLEIQYGWLPLLSDVYGAVQLLSPARDRALFRTRGTYLEEIHRKVSTALNGWIHRQAPSARRTWLCQLFWTIDDTAYLQAAKAGLLNPALVAWEIVPFSFVVDWFLPVGDYLHSLTGIRGIRFLGGSTGSIHRQRVQATCSDDGKPQGHLTPSGYAYRVKTQDTVLRVREVTSDYVLAPSQDVFNVTRALNSLALARVLFGKR